MPKHMHDGHRDRMRARIEKNGIMSLEAHEVLEYMLYSFIPRKDTNALAHRLIAEFGSLPNVLYADAQLLKQIPDMTENAVLFLKTLPDIFHLYLAQLKMDRDNIKSLFDVRDYMGSLLYNSPYESVCIAAVDVHERMIACDIVSVGGRQEVSLPVKSVVDYALKHKAYGIVLGHNHPTGSPDPSVADLALTCDIYAALNALGYKLLDHFIFYGDKTYSFKEMGRIEKFTSSYSSFKEGAY